MDRIQRLTALEVMTGVYERLGEDGIIAADALNKTKELPSQTGCLLDLSI